MQMLMRPKSCNAQYYNYIVKEKITSLVVASTSLVVTAILMLIVGILA